MPLGVVKRSVMLNEKIEELDKKIRALENEQINLNVRISSLENKKR
jgi:chaperonin cofactor prefoldin